MELEEVHIKKSIYNLILKNTIDGIVDGKTVSENIPRENSDISVGILNTVVINESKRDINTKKVFKIISEFNKNEISIEEFEERLINVDFKTLNIIDTLTKMFDEDNYSENIYEAFKILMCTTNNLEVCKLAIEMTALTDRCIELSDEYMLFGQVDHFSNSISFIFRAWIQFEEFKDDMFELLDISSDWQAIDYARSFMNIEEIIGDISNHRKLLIGALSNNSLKMEIAVELAMTLDIKYLISISKNDRELSLAIDDLFTSLLLELDRYGGIFAFENANEYLEMYLEFLLDTEFIDIKFVGFDTFNEFINDLEIHYSNYVEGDFDSIIREVKSNVQKFNTIENFDKALEYGEDNLYHLIRFAKHHDVSDSAIKYFEDLEEVNELDKSMQLFLESLLVLKGSETVKENLYKELCEICEKRKVENKEISKINVFNDYEGELIVSRKSFVKEFWSNGGNNLLKDLLNDYNPNLRLMSLEIIDTLKREELDNEMIAKIKERLVDAPSYIVMKAVRICEKFDIVK
ncbi:MAG: hypothetical protein ACRC41_13775 [Sarcina sp.]